MLPATTDGLSRNQNRGASYVGMAQRKCRLIVGLVRTGNEFRLERNGNSLTYTARVSWGDSGRRKLPSLGVGHELGASKSSIYTLSLIHI